MPIWSEAATGSAQRFAGGAVSLLAACGCVTDLFFGAETESVEALEKAGAAAGSPAFEAILREGLRQGLSYPAASGRALERTDPAAAGILEGPNNLLAAEYLRALRREARQIRPRPVLRMGAGHRDQAAAGGIASAGAIREIMRRGGDWESLVPEVSRPFAVPDLWPDDCSAALSAVLLRCSRAQLCDYEDVSDDLAGRILAQAPYLMSFTELAQAVQTRAYSLARVRRALCHILLGIRRGARPPRVLRVLGLRAASPVPALLKQNALWPVISKAADADPQSVKSMCDAAALYRQAVWQRSGRRLPGDLRQSPVILEEDGRLRNCPES